MSPPLVPDYVAIGLILTVTFVARHVSLARQGRLRGYSVVTSLVSALAWAGLTLVEVFVPGRGHSTAKLGLMGALLLVALAAGAVTRRRPEERGRRWRKARRRVYQYSGHVGPGR